MCHCHRYSCRGIGLIVLGLLVLGSGICHYYCYPDHRAQMERHIAEVCVKAAKEVR
jgi:hypothetical protein